MTEMQARANSRLFKLANMAQVFLLRRDWMGPAGNFLMVITTTGRKTGKQHSTPIGYQRDGNTIVAFTLGGHSNWYKNMLKNPQVTLTIKGQSQVMRGEPVKDEAEIIQILEIYKREQPNVMQRFFGVSPEASGNELLKARDKVALVRFRPLR